MSKHIVLGFIVGLILAPLAPSEPKAALVQFEFHGTQTDNPAATVQALLGLDSSLVVPNGTFTQANLSSFAPRIGLREQLTRDVRERFFDHAGVDASLLPRQVVEIDKQTLPGLVYLNGRLRAPVELARLDLESLQLPLSANLFNAPKSR